MTTKFKCLLAGAAFMAAAGAQAQTTTTYAGPGGLTDIDGFEAQNYNFTISNSGIINALSFAITTDANYGDDVTFTLTHLGTSVTFYNGQGDTPSSRINATFSDAAGSAAPYNGSAIGTFKPANPFSAFKGLAAGGVYTLSTVDNVAPGDGTALTASALTLTTSAVQTSAVPEPASWAMMILGVGMVGGFMRRRIRASEVRFDAKIKRISEGAAA